MTVKSSVKEIVCIYNDYRSFFILNIASRGGGALPSVFALILKY